MAKNQLLLEAISNVNLKLVIPVLKSGIESELINLQANELINDKENGKYIRQQISEAQVLLSYMRIITL